MTLSGIESRSSVGSLFRQKLRHWTSSKRRDWTVQCGEESGDDEIRRLTDKVQWAENFRRLGTQFRRRGEGAVQFVCVSREHGFYFILCSLKSRHVWRWGVWFISIPIPLPTDSVPLLATKCDREFPIHLCHPAYSCTPYTEYTTLQVVSSLSNDTVSVWEVVDWYYYARELERSGQEAVLSCFKEQHQRHKKHLFLYGCGTWSLTLREEHIDFGCL
jgi:hypothetical protein